MNTAVLFAVTVLVNALWQPAVIAAIAWAALKISRCNNATTRHAVWSLALVASFIVPLVSAMPIVLPHTPSPAATGHSTIPVSDATSSAHVKAAPSAHAVAPLQPRLTLNRPSLRVAPTLALIVAAAWLVLALAILARLLISLVYLNRLKHDALPLAVESRHALTRYDRAHKGDRDVRICVSDEITVPVAVGIFDAMILLPSDLVHELDANDLDRVLLHELAHVRRSDDWVNLFERVVQALFFFSPGIYWISRQMDLEREVACDDWVLVQSSENVPYARCLARIVEMTQWPYTAPVAPGVFVTRKSMSIRIERLLARGRDIRVRLALVPSLLALVFIVGVVVAGGFVSPTIAYTLDHKISRKPTHVAARHSQEVQVKTQYVYLPATPGISATTPPKTVTKTVPEKKPDFYVPAKHQFYSTIAAASASADAPKMVADASYLDDLAAAGYKNLTPEDVIALKSVGVTGQYIRDVQNAGLVHPSARDLISLKSLGVDGAWIAQIRAAGLTSLDARDLEGLKSLGVDGAYIKELATAGFPHLSARELEGLKSLGVDGVYVQKLRSHGFTNLTVRQLETFKSQGIEPQ